MPVIAAGLRVAVVSNVSIVTMAALLGIPQLGSLFTQGFQLRLYVPLVTGVVLCVVLAVDLRRLDHLAQQARNPMAAKDGHVVNIFGWLTDPTNWSGSDGIPMQIGYHLLYSAIALLAALVIAVPLGIVIGYTGRGEAVVAGFANALRALPTLGLLVLLFLVISPVVAGKLVYVLPTIVVLVLLAVPPILTGTYAGIQNADPDAVGAARGMGLHQAADPAPGPTSVCPAADDLRRQKLDPADRFDGHHRRLSRPAGSRPVHPRRPGPGELRRNGRWCHPRRRPGPRFSNSASPGSVGSSCRRGCGDRVESTSPVATTVPRRLPPRAAGADNHRRTS